MEILVCLVTEFQILTGILTHLQIIECHDCFHSRIVVSQVIIQAGDFGLFAVPTEEAA